MKFFYLFIIILSIYSCSKPKVVLICGDHVCVNKVEAEQYFEDNLTLEVKIINNEKIENVNLIQMNLKENINGKKKISLLNINKTENLIKTLSKSEIKMKKNKIKKRSKIKIFNFKEKNANKPPKEIDYLLDNWVDICTILEKCNIDEISKYLIKKGEASKFPDITKQE